MNKRDFFDGIAENWEKEHLMAPESGRLKDLVDMFGLAEGERVLDAGCGTGRLVPFLKRALGEKGFLVESDFSAEMLRIGQEKFGRGSVGFIQADAQSLPLRGKTFDAVVCFSLFPHISDKERALEEFRRILKPGKRLWLAHLMGRREINEFHSKVDGPVCHDMLPDREEMERLFRGAGFKVRAILDEPGLYLAEAEA